MIDKNVIQQVLGCLIKRPQLLSEVDKYSLTITDFPSRFERCIFAAIGGLYHNGAPRITPLDVANFLESDSSTKVIFEGQNGIEYLQDIEEFSNVENFSYYYHKLKKLNLLRDLKKQGMDTDDFYIEDLSNPKAIEVNSAFEELTTKDIINGIKRKLLKLESDYGQSDEVQTETIAEGIDDLIDNMAEDVNIGRPIQGDIYNQVINGAEPGALTIRSGSSGLGKTRQAVGDACLLAYPIRYNPNTCEWEQIGSGDKVLFIVTEQTMKQVRKMILAYLTGINESKFKFANFTNLERELLNTARDIIKEYEDNFIIIKAPNPTIELIKTLVRENCLTKDISHVFYDYIFIGPALLNEFRGFNLRNDKLFVVYIAFPLISGVFN